MSSPRNNTALFVLLLYFSLFASCGPDDTSPSTLSTEQVIVPDNLVGYWELTHFRPTDNLLSASLTISEIGTWKSETSLPLITGGYLSVEASGKLRIQEDQIKSVTESVKTLLPTSQIPVKTKTFDGQITFDLIGDQLTLYYDDGSMAIYQRAKK